MRIVTAVYIVDDSAMPDVRDIVNEASVRIKALNGSWVGYACDVGATREMVQMIVTQVNSQMASNPEGNLDPSPWQDLKINLDPNMPRND